MPRYRVSPGVTGAHALAREPRYLLDAGHVREAQEDLVRARRNQRIEAYKLLRDKEHTAEQ